MRQIVKLSGNDFYERFGAYLENSTATSEANDFEAAIEKDAYEHLVKDWENGWDFDSQFGYFGGRGASILIQNAQIDWENFWEWLFERTASIPPGALINFEVYDNINGKTMIAGPMLLRRVITATGTFEERDVDADSGASDDVIPPIEFRLPSRRGWPIRSPET